MLDGAPGHAARVAAGTGLTAPVVLGDFSLLRQFKVEAYPHTLILDRAGKPFRAFRGFHDRSDLLRALPL